MRQQQQPDGPAACKMEQQHCWIRRLDSHMLPAPQCSLSVPAEVSLFVEAVALLMRDLFTWRRC